MLKQSGEIQVKSCSTLIFIYRLMAAICRCAGMVGIEATVKDSQYFEATAAEKDCVRFAKREQTHNCRALKACPDHTKLNGFD